MLAAIYFDGVLLGPRWAGSKLAAGPELDRVDLVRLLGSSVVNASLFEFG